MFKNPKKNFRVIALSIALLVSICSAGVAYAQSPAGIDSNCLDSFISRGWYLTDTGSYLDQYVVKDNKMGNFRFSAAWQSVCKDVKLSGKFIRKAEGASDFITVSSFTAVVPTSGSNSGNTSVYFSTNLNGQYKACFWVVKDIPDITKCGGEVLKVTGGISTKVDPAESFTATSSSPEVSTRTANNPTETGIFYNALKTNTLGELMLLIMQGFILVVAGWAIMFIIVGGFRMVTSQGSSEALTKAKATITWAIAGVIVSLLAFSVIAAVQNLIGYTGF